MTRAALPRTWDPDAYELVDVGGRRRLERFAGLLLDRPAPAAAGERSDPGAWSAANARYERIDVDAGRWLPAAPAPWTITHGALVLEARATPSGGVGVFPEQVESWSWLADRVDARHGGGTAPEVLNLFGHTGAATLAAALTGARVVHVDASRPAVAWARHNAELSGLAAAPVRWIVDDALTFTRREARRGRRYDVIVLDPPSYGHGPDRRRWQLADGLPALLEACAAVLADGGGILLTAHTPGFDAERLADAVTAAVPGAGSRVDARELTLTAPSGARLPAGSAARFAGAA